MLSPGTKKRLSRISRRAIPEVKRAFEAGQISARRADILLYLAPEEQASELERLLRAREESVQRAKIAARVIKEYVEAGRRDLVALQKDLQHALSHTT